MWQGNPISILTPKKRSRVVVCSDICEMVSVWGYLVAMSQQAGGEECLAIPTVCWHYTLNNLPHNIIEASTN